MRILIAEDDNSTRVTLTDDLKAAGHDVTAVHDGSGAESALEGGSFDCAILDIRMPGADGVDLMKEIRSRSPETEVILMTGHGTM
ncbi:MAG: response regulator, partial [Candidatus Hydrogenedentes bacterium]|nr:response regulator [Candidatus Hydrogenedentota bacterium]